MVQRASESPLQGQALAGRQSPRSGVLYQGKSMLLTRAAEGEAALQPQAAADQHLDGWLGSAT